jgi:hypothetical protein
MKPVEAAHALAKKRKVKAFVHTSYWRYRLDMSKAAEMLYKMWKRTYEAHQRRERADLT